MRMTHFEFAMLSNVGRTSTFISLLYVLILQKTARYIGFPAQPRQEAGRKQKKFGNHKPETNNLQTFQVFSQQSKHKIKWTYIDSNFL